MAKKQQYDKYDVPTWAGVAPSGLHLDVLKEGKMIEKMMIDEKKCYFFGRNSIVCDFILDHASCSRVHAVLMWHKHLNRSFVVDLGSTHGTFLGSIRLEHNKPQQVLLDSTIRFGASSRSYILREKPQTAVAQHLKNETKEEDKEDELTGGLLGLPEEETELNNLTEFNTAHNKRVATAGFEDNLQSPEASRPRKRKHIRVSFHEDDEIINPEDIDPSVGRFRNLVQTSVVPIKKRRSDDNHPLGITADTMAKRLQGLYSPSLYSDLPNTNEQTSPTALTPTSPQFGTIGSSSLSFMHVPNLAPDVELAPAEPEVSKAPMAMMNVPNVPAGPKKKVYAKEAWPGKKPTPSLLL
ncbi:nuclear inhibitor of protein phosphatase 1-like [Amphiura filiformis]|uniref:nuclear inhibitor of protein phosphatase 1-like n=1 Tax=Amphiura filiformis TaxID=82378 RepID=UPI003B224FDE